MNQKRVTSADQVTIMQVVAKASHLLSGLRRENLPIDSSVMRFVVSGETYRNMLSEAPAALRTAMGNGINPNIWGIQLGRDNQVPDNEVELRWIVGRSWA